jgi:hypothetical protein
MCIGQAVRVVRTGTDVHFRAWHISWSLWTHSDRWQAPTSARTLDRPPWVPVLIAGLQFPAIRDQLMADIPGIDEPMDRVLLAQTNSKPHWSRVEWAEQLLLHAYTQQHQTLRPHPHRHRLHQLVGWQRQQSPPIPPTRPRSSRPRLLAGQAPRVHDQLRIGCHVMPLPRVPA